MEIDSRWAGVPEILRKMRDEMRKRNYENYLTAWEGKVRSVVRGNIERSERKSNGVFISDEK